MIASSEEREGGAYMRMLQEIMDDRHFVSYARRAAESAKEPAATAPVADLETPAPIPIRAHEQG
jgi:hypothetical protein